MKERTFPSKYKWLTPPFPHQFSFSFFAGEVNADKGAVDGELLEKGA